MPMLTTILFSRGTAIAFFSSSSFNSAGATSFSNLERSRGRSLALCCACAGAFCSCDESLEPFLSFSFAISFQLPLTVSECKKLLALSSQPLAFNVDRCVRLFSYHCCPHHWPQADS